MPAYIRPTRHLAIGFVQSRVTGKGGFTMGLLDQDTSIMRMRIAATPIELRKPEIGPQSKARGILLGAVLGLGAWAALIALGIAVWKWLG